METRSKVKKLGIISIPFLLSFGLPIWFMSFSSYFDGFSLPEGFILNAVLPMSALSMLPILTVSIIQKLKTRQL